MPMLQGLRTVIHQAPDLAKAKAWYAAAFGLKPYFDESFYVGYSVGGFELGLIPDPVLPEGPAGVITYWGVKDVGASFAHLLAQGARGCEEPRGVGGGITVASVVDPFGNVIGLIDNPHFDPKAVR